MKKQPTREKLLDITFDEVYIHGYNATSIDTILKKAGVPKGSMYHHFKSKKELVLAMVKERLFIKMDSFFVFELDQNSTVIQHFQGMLKHISKNHMLVIYGCPLYRLMVELSAIDKEFDTLLSSKAIEIQQNIQQLLQSGIKQGELNSQLDTDTFSAYMLSAIWGILSLPPSLSSTDNFLKQSHYIIEELKHYKN